MQLKLALFVLLFTPFLAHSSEIWPVKDPRVAKEITAQPKGTVLPWLDKETGKTTMVRITDYYWTKDSGNKDLLMFEIERSDGHDMQTYFQDPVLNKSELNGYQDPPIDYIEATPNFDSPIPDQKSSGNSLTPIDPWGENWGSGIGSAALSALEQGLLDALPYSRQIKDSYEAIGKMEQQIQNYQSEVESVRVSLRNSVISLNVKLKNQVAMIPQPISPQQLEKFKIEIGFKAKALRDHQWSSTDAKFIEQAEPIRDALMGARITDSIEQKFFDLGELALYEADYKSSLGQKLDSEFYLKIATLSADVLVGLDPYTGTARSIYEMVYGINLITDEPLSTTERVFASIGVFTAGYGNKASQIYRMVSPLAKKLGSVGAKSFAQVNQFLKATGHGTVMVGEGSLVRKINFASDMDPKWGLTRVHLNKHFFGNNPEFSLKLIDSAGNPDTWMQNMMDLVQKPMSKQYKDGVFEILGKFAKGDGSGFYEMGVKLWQRPDNSFDLVTILTKQTGKL